VTSKVPTKMSPLNPLMRRSPYLGRTAELGHVSLALYNHTYVAESFGRSGEAEYQALTERVTLWDAASQRNVEVRGPDALAFTDYLVPRDLSEFTAGRCTYTFLCDGDGRVLCDAVILMLAADTLWISHAGADLLLWVKGVAVGSSFGVTVSEPDVSALQLQGPLSGAVLREVIDPEQVDTLRYFRCIRGTVAGVDAIVSRTGWSGELGFEIYPLEPARALEVWDGLVKAGAAFDLMVTGFNFTRAIESGLLITPFASNDGLTPLEFWRGNMVDLAKGDFVGKESLILQSEDGARRQMVGLVGDGPEFPIIEAPWPVLRDHQTIAQTRWATYSLALQRNVAIVALPADHARIGSMCDVVTPDGVAHLMRVVELPFIDPEGARPRAPATR
jgi:glycine cleavage system aminomethyltransferase T